MATKRSKHVTDVERNILLKLIQPHMSILENIKDLSIFNQDEVWKTIAESYNELQTSGIKTIEELKECNKSLQKSASLHINNEKSQTYKTGGGKSDHQSSSISSKVMGMMGNRLESLESPYDCDGDFPGVLPIHSEDLPDITENQSFGSGSPIYYTVGPNEIYDAQAISTSTPCKNLLMKDNLWLLNSNEYSAKESAMDLSIHENTDQPSQNNDLQTKTKHTSSKLHEKLPNKKVPTATHTTAKKVYDSLENISNQTGIIYY